jgi:hypothetical protein
MSTLKEGGHLPKLNTKDIEPFLEPDRFLSEEVEIDLDVGYVNKSLDLSLDESYIQEVNSWGSSEDDQSQVSNTGDGRNRYIPAGQPIFEEDAFEKILVGDASPRRVTWDKRLDDSASEIEDGLAKQEEKKEEASYSNNQILSVSDPQAAKSKNAGWAYCTKRNKYYCYGYGKDLDEWNRKRDIALWQPEAKSKGNLAQLYACHSRALDAVADEGWGGFYVRSPPRIRGVTAVQDLVAKAPLRRQRRKERDQLRYVPDKIASAPKPWQLPYRERCKGNPGYIGVNLYSLLDSVAIPQPDPRDSSPWESRDVRQHFLHDQSIAFSRNWFGKCAKLETCHYYLHSLLILVVLVLAQADSAENEVTTL